MTDSVEHTAAPKRAVLISRLFNSPEITIDVTLEGIAIALPLADFIAALIAEVGSPAMVFSKTAIADRITQAAERVVSDMKKETARVM